MLVLAGIRSSMAATVESLGYMLEQMKLLFTVCGLSIINVCKQSRVLLQIATDCHSLRQEAVDGAMFVNFDIYNAVLGSGKAQGFFTLKPDPDTPGDYGLVS